MVETPTAPGGSSWLIRGVVLPEAGSSGGLSEPVDVHLHEGRIAQIGPADSLIASPDLPRIDGHGKLLLPGLVNAHFHSTGTFNRSVVENLPLELFMLYELPPFDFGPFPPALYRTQALLAVSEMLKVGVTAVMDDALFYPHVTDETVDALMGAYRDAGIRATVGVYQPNKAEDDWIPGLRELLPRDVVARMQAEPPGSTDQLMQFAAAFIDRWHGTSAGRLRCALSCSAPHRATDDYLLRLHALSKARDLPFIFHVYETKLQRVAAGSFYGTSTIRHLRDIDVLDARSVIVHAVWVDDADISDIARCGAVVVHSPAGNLRCGSGVMPYRRLRAAGVPVALCTDEATVESHGNLWNVARLAGMLHTISDPDYTTWPTASEMLEAMTTAGARAFGHDGELGIVREGAIADLILVDLRRIGRTPPRRLASALVYGEDGSSVTEVFVDGRMVVRDAKLLTIDEAQLRSDIAHWTRVWAQALESVDEWARRLAPAYDDLYRRAALTDVGINRWAGNEGTWFGEPYTSRHAQWVDAPKPDMQ